MKNSRRVYKGLAASPGKSYGKALKITSGNHLILHSHITEKEIPIELQKFDFAVKKAKKSLDYAINKFSKFLDKDILEIITAQAMMLQDPTLINGVNERIKKNNENAPLALYHVIQSICDKMSEIENQYLRDRVQDIREIGKIIEDKLISKKDDSMALSSLKDEVIVVATELSPIQLIHINKEKVIGLITEKGGTTGHLAILARSYQIPAIVGVNRLLEDLEDEEEIFLDAEKGEVIRKPSKEKIQSLINYQTIKKDSLTDDRETLTSCGQRILLKINVDNEVEDCATGLNLNADGVGLYRSESMLFRFIGHTPGEEEQFQIYRKLAEGMKKKPVIIRTFDPGADKLGMGEREENPFLGNRGIRYCLRNEKWFKKQLRAILRAAAYGDVSIMLPMVSHPSEVKVTKKIIEDCKNELRSRGLVYKPVRVGIMLETPAAAFSVDIFLKDADFFSVGTNDLLQYTVAVDRNNPNLGDIYNNLHIAFLRILKRILDVANGFKIPIGICGEIASNSAFIPLLLGLGFREFSVSPPFLKSVRNAIRNISLEESKKIAEKVVFLSEKEQYRQINRLLTSYLSNSTFHKN